MQKQASANDLWFLPLGGTGEIGMNVNLYGCNKQWLMVDCGVTFDVPLNQKDDYNRSVARYDLVSADLSFISNRRDMLCGLVLTHAHEDHLGAVIYQWQQLQCPIYTTAFTAEVLRRKAYRAELNMELPIVVVKAQDILDIGPFTVEWIASTHSIPEANALLISTEHAKILHTGDWKIDYKPVIGEPFNLSLFKSLQQKNITALVCDSTNATKTGRSVSEKMCEQGLGSIISKASGRVVVTCFASNVARLITIAKIAYLSKRYLCLLGPALENMVSIARASNFWPDEFTITPSRHIAYLAKHEVLIVATGSQGETRAALNRLAMDTHRDCQLDEGDSVIFSSIVIPGNENAVKRLISLFEERNIAVHQSENSEHTIHASGHPNQEDLKLLFSAVKPKCVIPVHGEPEHLSACAQIASDVGIKNQLVGLNGDLFMIKPNLGLKRKAVKAPRVIL